MKNIKKQDYKKVLFLGAFIEKNLIELMSTTVGRSELYELLKLYSEGKTMGGEIDIFGDKYKVIIG